MKIGIALKKFHSKMDEKKIKKKELLHRVSETDCIFFLNTICDLFLQRSH